MILKNFKSKTIQSTSFYFDVKDDDDDDYFIVFFCYYLFVAWSSLMSETYATRQCSNRKPRENTSSNDNNNNNSNNNNNNNQSSNNQNTGNDNDSPSTPPSNNNTNDDGNNDRNNNNNKNGNTQHNDEEVSDDDNENENENDEQQQASSSSSRRDAGAANAVGGGGGSRRRRKRKSKEADGGSSVSLSTSPTKLTFVQSPSSRRERVHKSGGEIRVRSDIESTTTTKQHRSVLEVHSQVDDIIGVLNDSGCGDMELIDDFNVVEQRMGGQAPLKRVVSSESPPTTRTQTPPPPNIIKTSSMTTISVTPLVVVAESTDDISQPIFNAVRTIQVRREFELAARNLTAVNDIDLSNLSERTPRLSSATSSATATPRIVAAQQQQQQQSFALPAAQLRSQSFSPPLGSKSSSSQQQQQQQQRQQFNPSTSSTPSSTSSSRAASPPTHSLNSSSSSISTTTTATTARSPPPPSSSVPFVSTSPPASPASPSSSSTSTSSSFWRPLKLLRKRLQHTNSSPTSSSSSSSLSNVDETRELEFHHAASGRSICVVIGKLTTHAELCSLIIEQQQQQLIELCEPISLGIERAANGGAFERLTDLFGGSLLPFAIDKLLIRTNTPSSSSSSSTPTTSSPNNEWRYVIIDANGDDASTTHSPRSLPTESPPPRMRPLFRRSYSAASIHREMSAVVEAQHHFLSARSDNVLEKLLVSEAHRRNEIEQFDAFISHCRTAFPLSSDVATLSLAMLVAVDLLVSLRWVKVQVAFINHESMKGCFVGWQHNDSQPEIILPMSASSKSQNPKAFRSLIASTEHLLPNCKGATLAIVASDSTVVYYKCATGLRKDPLAVIATSTTTTNNDIDDDVDEAQIDNEMI